MQQTLDEVNSKKNVLMYPAGGGMSRYTCMTCGTIIVFPSRIDDIETKCEKCKKVTAHKRGELKVEVKDQEPKKEEKK